MKRLDTGHPSRRYVLLAILVGVFGVGARATASSYTYDMNGFEALTGFITTNCDNCALTSGNITAWAFNSSFGQVSVASSVAGAQVYLQGDALDATPTAITFGFAPAPTGGAAGFISANESVNFLSQAFEASVPLEFPNGIGEFDACNPGTILFGSSQCSGNLVQGTQKIFGARAVAAPELDPASWISAVSLLAGALLILRGRRQQIAR
jgi:hypothetical protein